MNDDRWRKFFMVGSFLFPVAILLAVVLLTSHVKDLRKNMLSSQRELNLLQRQTISAERRISMYKDILGSISDTPIMNPPQNEVDLFSVVQKQLTANGVLSRVIDEASEKNLPGDHAVKISFEGPYPAFIRTLADWRRLDIALRVKSMTLTGFKDRHVRGDIVLDTVVGK